MRKLLIVKLPLVCVMTLVAVSNAFAQKRGAAKPATNPIVFAVIDDGERIEPIGAIVKSELRETTGGDADAKLLKSFANEYYKPRTVYNLIFGGAKKRNRHG